MSLEFDVYKLSFHFDTSRADSDSMKRRGASRGSSEKEGSRALFTIFCQLYTDKFPVAVKLSKLNEQSIVVFYLKYEGMNFHISKYFITF